MEKEVQATKQLSEKAAEMQALSTELELVRTQLEDLLSELGGGMERIVEK